MFFVALSAPLTKIMIASMLVQPRKGQETLLFLPQEQQYSIHDFGSVLSLTVAFGAFASIKAQRFDHRSIIEPIQVQRPISTSK
jgi:hypothetical protein